MLCTFIGRALSALGMYPGSSLHGISAAWQGTSSLICRFPTSKMNQLLKLPPAELVFHAVKSDAPFPNGRRTSPTLTAFPKGSGQRKLSGWFLSVGRERLQHCQLLHRPLLHLHRRPSFLRHSCLVPASLGTARTRTGCTETCPTMRQTARYCQTRTPKFLSCQILQMAVL